MSNKPFNFISSKNETLSAESRETALRAENERLADALESAWNLVKSAQEMKLIGEKVGAMSVQAVLDEITTASRARSELDY